MSNVFLRNVDAVSARLGDMVGATGSLARRSFHEPSRGFVCIGDWEISHTLLEAALPMNTSAPFRNASRPCFNGISPLALLPTRSLRWHFFNRSTCFYHATLRCRSVNTCAKKFPSNDIAARSVNNISFLTSCTVPFR